MSRQYLHQGLLEGRWFTMSIEEQLGNIGSEIHRTILHRNKPDQFWNTVARALELYEFTLSDLRWRGTGRIREIAKTKELYCGAVLGCNQYNTSLEDLNKYFLYFACVARGER